jgi:flagellum-specific peptidoglycan hydrolase FlgJ
MNQRHLSRKERRKLIKQKHRQQIIKKSGALVGTTMVLGTLGIGAVPFTQAAPATAAESANATSVDKFIETLAPYAQETASANDLYASVMLAQAIVESGWGQSSLSTAPNHNLFGITGAYQGASIALSTQEFLNQNWSTVVQNFRKYPSYTESFQDNANVIKNTVLGGKSYYSGAWKSNASNYKEATAYLTGRYATAPNYDQVLNQIIEKYNLTQYDTAGSAAQATDNTTAANEAVLTPLALDTTNQTTNTAADPTAAAITENGLATHTVIAGESVWGISHAYGMTMKDFKALNGIGSNNFVYPGMVVKVANVQTEATASAEATGTHIVRTGESVWGISHAYGMSMDEFKALNGIGANNFVYPGMVVKVTGTQTETSTVDVPEATGTYTVKAGESVWSISHAHGMAMEGFKALNGIGDDNFVYAGMVVKISGAAETPAATEEAAAPAEEAQTPAPAETTPAATEEVKAETPAPAEEPAANLPAATGTYTVKAGDSVWSIADAYGMTMADFKALNGIGDDNYVYPGLVVKTSGEAKQAAETPAQPAAPAENTQTDSNQAAAADQTASRPNAARNGCT